MKILSKPRWIAGHLLATALVVAFVNFGFWQLRRHRERQERNAVIELRLAAPTEPLASLLARFDPEAPEASPDALALRSAEAAGRYDPDRELLLRSRSYNGQPGWHLLTPLLLPDGRALLVDRGWVPYRFDSPPVAEAAPAQLEVTVRGVLQPEQDPPSGLLAAIAPRDPPTGPLQAVFYVDRERLAPQFPYPLVPVFLELREQVPSQQGVLPALPEPPELGAGPHLGYAVQWFSFALIGVVGYALLLRAVLRERPARGTARNGEARR